MTYSTGTIAVTPGSDLVIGEGTQFKTYVAAGDVMVIPGIPIGFKVERVIDDWTLKLDLPAPGTGAAQIAGLSFIIGTNFSPVLSMPLPGPHMLDVQGAINRAWKILDREIPKP